MKTIKVNMNDLSKTSRTPVLTYCRQLIKKGEDYKTRLEVYRIREEPDVIVKCIGDAAKITVREDRRLGPVFVKYREVDIDSLDEDQTPHVAELSVVS